MFCDNEWINSFFAPIYFSEVDHSDKLIIDNCCFIVFFRYFFVDCSASFHSNDIIRCHHNTKSKLVSQWCDKKVRKHSVANSTKLVKKVPNGQFSHSLNMSKNHILEILVPFKMIKISIHHCNIWVKLQL